MNLRHIILGSAAAAAFFSSNFADAIVISGSYSGVATVVSGPSLETSMEPVTGSFAFENDPSTCPPPLDPDVTCQLPFSWDVRYPNGLITTLDSIEAITSSIQLSQSANRQTVTLALEQPHGAAAFTFASRNRSLFHDFDLSTFNPRAVNVDDSSAGYSGMFLDVAIDFTTLTFNALSSVPEPGTSGMLLVGIAAIVLVGRGRKFDPRHLLTRPLNHR